MDSSLSNKPPLMAQCLLKSQQFSTVEGSILPPRRQTITHASEMYRRTIKASQSRHARQANRSIDAGSAPYMHSIMLRTRSLSV